ncbi:hypothetical protein GGI15_003245 [Coemansia interrupta]|uniref:GATA-type domain-containing protein n=1 Tax=Coemansia interrupta TaxID=1126814 RepID=A0A9W8LJB6_9FUNG|nr:hypothetical protein GGI15_003245 [Coemansia interrupta]
MSSMAPTAPGMAGSLYPEEIDPASSVRLKTKQPVVKCKNDRTIASKPNSSGMPSHSMQNASGSSTSTPSSTKRKPAKRTARHFVEEPLYMLPSHYALLQDSTFELLRGLANLSSAVEDDPLYFDQLLGAAVNIKHAFDLGRMDVINGTIRPRNTSLCHECITTVSSVWRSGPDGPRSLCNACGLRYYKQNQRRALEAKRKETKEAADAAASLAALSGVPLDVARRILSRRDVLDAAERLKGHTADHQQYSNAEEDDDDDEEDSDQEDDYNDDEAMPTPPAAAPPFLGNQTTRLSIANLCQSPSPPPLSHPVAADASENEPVYVPSMRNILTSTQTIQRDTAAAEYADSAHNAYTHQYSHNH